MEQKYNKTLKILFFIIFTIFILSFSYITSNATTMNKVNLGKTRLYTALNIEELANKKGESRSEAVLVAYSDNTDGIIASGLGLPVFYYKNDTTSTQKDELDLINRLKNFSKVYVIGGTLVISENVVYNLEKFNISVERIFGSSRYATSVAVAQKMKSQGKLKGILLTQSAKDDNMTSSVLVGIASRNGYAILFNDSETVDNSVAQFIKSSKVPVYAIGNVSTKGTVITKRITGNDIYDLNKKLINYFGSYKRLVLIPNAIDAVPASYLAKVTNSSILLVNNKNLNMYNISSMKNSNIYSVCPDEYSNLINNAINNKNKFQIDKKVVFYVPHQDDETLFMGQTILKAIEKVGANNVYTVLISDGAKSNAQKNYTIKRRLTIADVTFSEARDNEYYYACKELGIPTSNILYAEDLNLNREQDGNVNKDKVIHFIKYFENKFNSNVVHITYSYVHDMHDDHKALGEALLEVYKTNLSKYSNRVYFITRSDFTYNIPSKYLKTISETKYQNKNLIKISNAINVYKTFDKSRDLVGVGYVSVSKTMDNITNTIRNGEALKTKIHLPYNV